MTNEAATVAEDEAEDEAIFRVEVEMTLHGYIEIDAPDEERAKKWAISALHSEGMEIVLDIEPWFETVTGVERKKPSDD